MKVKYDRILDELREDDVVPGIENAQFSYSINGNGGVILINSVGGVILRAAGTITSWRIAEINGISGSIVIDVKVNGTSLVGGGNKPTLSSQSSNNANVSGWTSTTISANDLVTINVDSASTVTNIALTIYYTKS